MEKPGTKTKKTMKKTLLLAALLASLISPVLADSGAMLSSSVVSSNATTTVSSPVEVAIPYKGASLTIMPVFSAAGAGTSNVVFTLNIGDGTTWTTTGPLSLTLAANGTNSVVGLMTFDKTNFVNGVNRVKLSTVATTQTNNVTVTAVNYYTTPP